MDIFYRRWGDAPWDARGAPYSSTNAPPPMADYNRDLFRGVKVKINVEDDTIIIYM